MNPKDRQDFIKGGLEQARTILMNRVNIEQDPELEEVLDLITDALYLAFGRDDDERGSR